MTPVMRSTPRSWRRSSAGARRKPSTPASRKRSSGISTTTGGGVRCGSAMPVSASACSRPRTAERGMRIVVTGREGQVVRSLIERGSHAGHEVVALGRPELDLAGETPAIVSAIEASRPDVIVSAAAYTAVDKAESEPDLAFAINESGARAVARAASRLGVPLLHLSTDYVFDGTKEAPYVED